MKESCAFIFEVRSIGSGRRVTDLEMSDIQRFFSPGSIPNFFTRECVVSLLVQIFSMSIGVTFHSEINRGLRRSRVEGCKKGNETLRCLHFTFLVECYCIASLMRQMFLSHP